MGKVLVNESHSARLSCDSDLDFLEDHMAVNSAAMKKLRPAARGGGVWKLVSFALS